MKYKKRETTKKCLLEQRIREDNGKGPDKPRTAYEKQKLRKGFKRRAATEPKIGHLKQDHRLSRNFYKGIKDDNKNVMLAAAMNFKRMMNIYKQMFFDFFIRLIYIIQNCPVPQNSFTLLPEKSF